MFSLPSLKSSKTLMELCVINLVDEVEREREGGREGGRERGGWEGGCEGGKNEHLILVNKSRAELVSPLLSGDK